MTEESNSAKTPVTSTHDKDADKLVGNQTVKQSINNIAMDMAKRGKSRFQKDEEGNSIFSK